MRKSVQFLPVGCALLALALLPGVALTSVRAETTTTLAVISGTVKDDAGQPLGGAVVALFEVALNGREVKSVKTEYDGKFTTSISAGVYKLRAAADGYRAVLTRVSLDASEKKTFDFALKREDRLVDQRGDRDDYRWIGRSVPRHVLHLDANGSSTSTAPGTTVDVANNEPIDRYTGYRPSFHGAMQFVAASSLAGSAFAGPASFGTNFAVAGNIRGVEMALIGQRGFGGLAPQRVEAIASLRPAPSHQITASVGYGEIAYGKPRMLGADGIQPDFDNNSVIPPVAAVWSCCSTRRECSIDVGRSGRDSEGRNSEPGFSFCCRPMAGFSTVACDLRVRLRALCRIGFEAARQHSAATRVPVLAQRELEIQRRTDSRIGAGTING